MKETSNKCARTARFPLLWLLSSTTCTVRLPPSSCARLSPLVPHLASPLPDWIPSQTDKNIARLMEPPAPSAALKHLKLPRDLDAYSFAKFTSVYFRTHAWEAKTEPIHTPFLSKTSESDLQDSLLIFKLVMSATQSCLSTN